MPVKTWDLKSDFDGAYSIRMERYNPNGAVGKNEIRGNYERSAIFSTSIPQLDYVTPEWERILDHFRWPTSTSICLDGCGFAWSIEYLNAQGFMDVWGNDTSAYIQSDKTATDSKDNTKRSLVPDKIDNASFTNNNEVVQFLLNSGHRNGPAGEEPFDVCVTERVLSSLTDAECVQLSADTRTFEVVKTIAGGNGVEGLVMHIEHSTVPGPGNDPLMNWKTLADWKTLLPNDTMVSSGGGEFL